MDDNKEYARIELLKRKYGQADMSGKETAYAENNSGNHIKQYSEDLNISYADLEYSDSSDAYSLTYSDAANMPENMYGLMPDTEYETPETAGERFTYSNTGSYYMEKKATSGILNGISYDNIPGISPEPVNNLPLNSEDEPAEAVENGFATGRNYGLTSSMAADNRDMLSAGNLTAGNSATGNSGLSSKDKERIKERSINSHVAYLNENRFDAYSDETLENNMEKSADEAKSTKEVLSPSSSKSDTLDSGGESDGNMALDVIKGGFKVTKKAATTTARATNSVLLSYVKGVKLTDYIVNNQKNMSDMPKDMSEKGVKKAGHIVKRFAEITLRSLWKIIKPVFVGIYVTFPLLIPFIIILLIATSGGASSAVNSTVEVLGNTAGTDSTTTTTTDYVTAGDVDAASLSAFINSYVHYNQGSYSNYMGINSKGQLRTISQAGCGLTAIASMIASWSNNTSVTPVTVLNYALNGKDGSKCSVILVSDELVQDLCTKNGLKCEKVTPKNRTKLQEALAEGKSVMVMLSSSAKWTDGKYVTSSTHYIVLMGYSRPGIIECMNPAGGGTNYISEDTVINDKGTDTFRIVYNEDIIKSWKSGSTTEATEKAAKKTSGKSKKKSSGKSTNK